MSDVTEGPTTKRDLAALADTLRFAIDFHRAIDEKLGRESPNECWPENVAEIYLAVRAEKEERGAAWEHQIEHSSTPNDTEDM